MSSRFVSGGTIEGNVESKNTLVAAKPLTPSSLPHNTPGTALPLAERKSTSQNRIVQGAPPPASSEPFAPSLPSSNPPLLLNKPSTTTATLTAPLSPKSQAWATVQSSLEAERLRRSQSRLQSHPEEPSLFAILQANKAAKQAAFEEANKIRNQFRSLDDDEIGFLEDVWEGERRREERERREEEEGLRVFRGLKGKGEGVGGDVERGMGMAVDGEEEVVDFVKVGVRGKRKRGGEKASVLGLVKRREVNKPEKGEENEPDKSRGLDGSETPAKKATDGMSMAKATSPPVISSKPAGLVAYDSDDDSD